MIIAIWVITCIISIVGGIICGYTYRLHSIISGSRLMEIESSIGARYVDSYNVWQYVAYISAAVVMAMWICSITMSIYEYRKKQLKSTDVDTANAGTPQVEPPMQYYGGIMVLRGSMKGAELDLNCGEKIIAGRDPAVSHLILSSKKSSRRHCSVQYSPERQRYRLRCYSANGVYYEESIQAGRKKVEKDHVAWVSNGTLVFMPDEKEVIRLK